jgi:hypothetical protein
MFLAPFVVTKAPETSVYYVSTQAQISSVNLY